MQTETQKRQIRFLSVVIAHIDQKVRDFIESQISVIHPDYRNAARIAIRHMSAENLLFTGKTPDEIEEMRKLMMRFWVLSSTDEIEVKVRAHALSIAQDALELRRHEIDRAKCGMLPRLAATSNEPAQAKAAWAHEERRATMRRVV